MDPASQRAAALDCQELHSLLQVLKRRCFCFVTHTALLHESLTGHLHACALPKVEEGGGGGGGVFRGKAEH